MCGVKKKKKGTYKLIKTDILIYIWRNADDSERRNDIIHDQANSQLVKMIIPKEALTGLLTLAIQEYEPYSGASRSNC